MTAPDLASNTEAEAAGIQRFPKPAPGSWTEAFGLDTGPVSFHDCVDPEFYELEKQAVFRRSWLYGGRIEQLPRKGTYFTKELPFLNLSVLFVRGLDDQVRAFHNVCTHRGNKLMWEDYPNRESHGACRQMACKYHGWRFDLEGEISYVHNAPEFFDLKADDIALAKIHCEVWAGFIFFNLEETPSQGLREFLTPGVEALESYPFDKMTEHYVIESDIAANWKLYMDAFQELYHVPFVHGLMNNPADSPKHTHLMWSRDGFVWERLPDRPQFVPNGAPGEWDQGSVSVEAVVPQSDLRVVTIDEHCQVVTLEPWGDIPTDDGGPVGAALIDLGDVLAISLQRLATGPFVEVAAVPSPACPT